MPAFVIHSIGSPPRKVVVDSSPVRVGRDPTADICLQEPSVSREHAVFINDEHGRWYASCVSETNPIVVDGAVTTTGTLVREGTEVLVGGSHMIIFCDNAFSANQYIETKRHFEQGACERCNWSGMVSSLSKSPKCPRCALPLRTTASYESDARHSDVPMNVSDRRRFAVGTAQMSVDGAQEMWARIKAAKLSRLERIDGRDPSTSQVQLAEDRATEIGRRPGAGLRLSGFVFGHVVVAWDGSRFVATSALSFPSMKINGQKTRSAQLAHGDVLEVGSNRFRFMTGKGGAA